MSAYTKKSPLKLVKKKIKGTLTDNQKNRLKKHREFHKKDGNDISKLNKHMKVMKDLMRQNMSFKKAHIEAQKKYPMKSG